MRAIWWRVQWMLMDSCFFSDLRNVHMMFTVVHWMCSLSCFFCCFFRCFLRFITELRSLCFPCRGWRSTTSAWKELHCTGLGNGSSFRRYHCADSRLVQKRSLQTSLEKPRQLWRRFASVFVVCMFVELGAYSKPLSSKMKKYHCYISALDLGIDSKSLAGNCRMKL